MVPIMLGAALFTFNAANLLMMLVLILSAWLYSAPPIRLKVHPPLDAVVNGLIYGWAPYALGHSFHQPLQAMPAQAGWLTLGAIGAHAYAAVRDRTADQAAGMTTIAVALGARATLLLVGILWTAILVGGNFETREVRSLVTICLVIALVSACLPDRLLEPSARVGLRLIVLAFLFFATRFLIEALPGVLQ